MTQNCADTLTTNGVGDALSDRLVVDYGIRFGWNAIEVSPFSDQLHIAVSTDIAPCYDNRVFHPHSATPGEGGRTPNAPPHHVMSLPPTFFRRERPGNPGNLPNQDCGFSHGFPGLFRGFRQIPAVIRADWHAVSGVKANHDPERRFASVFVRPIERPDGVSLRRSQGFECLIGRRPSVSGWCRSRPVQVSLSSLGMGRKIWTVRPCCPDGGDEGLDGFGGVEAE